MATQTVFNQNNVVLPAAPPTYYAPSPAGVAVPAGKTAWELLFDTTGLTPGQLLVNVTLEYQRAAQWTDKAGFVHPANEWLPDMGADLRTGPQGKTGSPIARMASSIGAVGPGGVMVEPYPSNARFRVDQCPGWTVPNIKLNLS